MSRKAGSARRPVHGQRRIDGADDHNSSDLGWVEYGGELIWAVGYTPGGAPFGLLASEMDPVDLTALGAGTDDESMDGR